MPPPTHARPASAENTQPWVALHETHSGVVLLMGERALKFKKPVDFGFLDFTTVDRRREVCEREVALNKRLAPDAYEGVGTLCGPDGSVIDHVVMMQRMPESRRLSSLVRAGVDVDTELREVARQLASFHARAQRSEQISKDVTADSLGALWQSNFDEMSKHADLVEPSVEAEIETLVRRYLVGREALFDARIAGGSIVDGHGDLLAEDIFCLDDGPRILDCLEFDDRLRHLDQVDDAAFLAMDLEHLGAPDLGVRFLRWYAQFTGDTPPSSLVEHYLAYRAFVRAKVACLRHGQGDTGAAVEARRFATAALDHLERAAVKMVLVGGSPGTGKSTVAAGLADRFGMALVSSDRVRKELANLSPLEGAAAPRGEGVYTAAWTERVYAEMVRRAAELMSVGESVVLDATWADSEVRDRARLGAEVAAGDLIQIRCGVPADVADGRITSRATPSAAGTVSDVSPALAAGLRAEFVAWPEALNLNTDRDLEPTLLDAATYVRPPRCGTSASRLSSMAPD